MGWVSAWLLVASADLAWGQQRGLVDCMDCGSVLLNNGGGGAGPAPELSWSRTYTLPEIAEMRLAVKEIVERDAQCSVVAGCQYWPEQQMIELRLQTYMRAGISPEELVKAAVR
jgi:hypothetical protein